MNYPPPKTKFNLPFLIVKAPGKMLLELERNKLTLTSEHKFFTLDDMDCIKAISWNLHSGPNTAIPISKEKRRAKWSPYQLFESFMKVIYPCFQVCLGTAGHFLEVNSGLILKFWEISCEFLQLKHSFPLQTSLPLLILCWSFFSEVFIVIFTPFLASKAPNMHFFRSSWRGPSSSWPKIICNLFLR